MLVPSLPSPFSPLTTTPTMVADVYIVSAARTPVGSFNGTLKAVPATELGSTALKAAVERSGLAPSDIQEVLFGHVLQGSAGQAPARQAAIGAGLPVTTDATTVNKVCAAGLKAVALATQSIQLGHHSVSAAGGMESMSNAPYYIGRNATGGFGHGQLQDALVRDGLSDAYSQEAMGICAEETAKKFDLSREAQDAYAIESYNRAAQAWASELFKNEIVPVTIKDRRGNETVVNEDEEFKKVKLEKIPSLRPVFKKDGTITAANASTINDGASAVVLASAEEVQKRDLKPLARIVSYADAAVEPVDFPIAPASAIPIALKRAGLTADQVALWEVNEAFAAVALANAKILTLDLTKVNTRGGGVSLGHPLGSSGSRILVTLTHALQPGQYGVAAVCNGGGGATAMVIQRL